MTKPAPSPRKPAPRPFARRRASPFPPVIGCDEVGRGALCGPVVVCAVWFEPEALPKGLLARLDDSKKIDRAEREALYPLIVKASRACFAARSARCIDVYNIRNATLQAMTQAVARLGLDAPVRIDGIDVPRGIAGDALAVVKGDAKVPQIAAASILAKVMRDRLMARLSLRHVQYRWEQNSGYGTKAHREAILAHGHTHHHRRSFGDLFSALSDGGQRLVTEPAPDAERLYGLGDIVDPVELHALPRAG